ncbi:MAG TPA: MaoC family dehydratase N-terminal domain-containing protein [Ktedonobacterales bacterium]|jgi:acyl dehydratase|nr:MaoC family dehydratase N-terminal domain-containing protein [Ktedonobacterales bacterium]
MPPTLPEVGHQTAPQSGVVSANDIRQFAEAVGDPNPIFRDEAAARATGYTGIPAEPTFVTRFHVAFADAGLDPEHTQVLHGEQEYTYERPLVAGDQVTVRYVVSAVRQSRRADGMAIMTLEQQCDTAAGERVATGKAIIIVRDMAPAGGGETTAGKQQPDPDGERIPDLSKQVTQEQINAYADVSGDHNPIHHDPATARSVGLEGTIAHGMLSMAFLGQLVTDWLSSQPSRGGWVKRLRVRFQAMVRPGDTLICGGALAPASDGQQRIELWINNQRGERVTTGDADAVFAR